MSLQQAVSVGDNILDQQPVGLITTIYSVRWGNHVMILDKVIEITDAILPPTINRI